MPLVLKISENLENITGVNAGSPTTIDLPADRGAIHTAEWECRKLGTLMTRPIMLAAFEKAELVAGGRVYSDYRVEDILMLDDFYGEAFSDGILPHRFAQYTRQTIVDAEHTSIIPQIYVEPKLRLYVKPGQDDITLRMELDSEGVGSANRLAFDKNPINGLQPIEKHWFETVLIKSSGTNKNDFRFPHTGERIRSFNFMGGNITGIAVYVDGQLWQDFRSLNALNRRLISKGYNPQTDIWHINYEALSGGVMEAAFDPVRNGRESKIDFEIYTDSATNVDLLVEMYGTPPLK